jgi:predicted GTPase
VVIIRHPMPYGPDLNAQRCQRYQEIEDLERYSCTIEEREEYEAHIQQGHILYAGVDYDEILRNAEREADILLWDGGNNDLPFYRPDLHIVLVDPHRPGHEIRYHPGETNLRMAQVVVVNKSGNASPQGLEQVLSNVRAINTRAEVIRADSVLSVQEEQSIRGKRVLVVEDGPTLTHGEMAYGAAHTAARKFGAAAIVDPRPYAVGSIRETFAKFSHLVDVLPAMGYGAQQVRELEQTINAVPCDLVLVGTPLELNRLIKPKHPMLRVSYSLDPAATQALDRVLEDFLSTLGERRGKDDRKTLPVDPRPVHG